MARRPHHRPGRRWSDRLRLGWLSSRRHRPKRFRRTWLTDRPGIRTLLWTVGILVLVLGAAGLVAALRFRQAASDLRTARDILRRVEVEVSDGRLAEARSELGNAQNVIARANNRVYGGVEFDLIDWLPVVHQNVRALRSSVGLAYTMVNGGAQILTSAKSLQGPTGRLEVSLTKGSIPLSTVVDTEQATAQLASSLPGKAQKLDSNLLIGPVAKLQRSVRDEATKRRTQLEVLARGMALLDDMAGASGPRHYLIAVANTAEERGAGGMVLSYGELDAADGKFTLGKFEHVDALPPVAKPVGTTLPDDYRQRWDGYPYATNFRQATLGADFPTVAPVLGQLYTASSGKAVDGVIQIDPAGLAAIVANTGPVDVPGLGQVTAQDLVDYSVNRAYFQFPDRDQRQSVLGDVARAAFDKLLSGEYPSLRRLASDLSDSVAGRHILMWTDDEVAATQLRFFDADGALPPASSNYLALTVQNMSGNKLDYYLGTSLDVHSVAAPAGDGRRFVDVAVRVANDAPPDGTLRYVFGPFTPNLKRGRYHGVVSLYVPTGTAFRGADGPSSTPPAVYTEGGREVVSFEIDTDAGRADTFVLHLALLPVSSDASSLLLVPQARIRPTRVTVALDQGRAGMVRGDVVLDQSWQLAPSLPAVPASGPKLAPSRTG